MPPRRTSNFNVGTRDLDLVGISYDSPDLLKRLAPKIKQALTTNHRWPVRSGDSLRGFYTFVSRFGKPRLMVRNRERYAGYVEAFTAERHGNYASGAVDAGALGPAAQAIQDLLDDTNFLDQQAGRAIADRSIRLVTGDLPKFLSGKSDGGFRRLAGSNSGRRRRALIDRGYVGSLSSKNRYTPGVKKMRLNIL